MYALGGAHSDDDNQIAELEAANELDRAKATEPQQDQPPTQGATESKAGTPDAGHKGKGDGDESNQETTAIADVVLAPQPCRMSVHVPGRPRWVECGRGTVHAVKVADAKRGGSKILLQYTPKAPGKSNQLFDISPTDVVAKLYGVRFPHCWTAIFALSAVSNIYCFS